MNFSHRRMQREANTIKAMIEIYCHDHHQSDEILCQNCKELMAYALKRLANCPFQEKKSTCGNCTIHCYKKNMREKVREVMRYSGPKMIWKHPLLAIGHLIDGFRKAPKLEKKKQ